MSLDKLLRVVIAGQPLGIPLDRVHSLLRLDTVQYSPARLGPFAWILGPEEIEIWQLHRLYGIEPPVGDGRSAVRFAEKMPRALLVDQVEGKIESPPETRFPNAAFSMASAEPFISEIAVVEGRALPVLNVDALGAVDTATLAEATRQLGGAGRSSALRGELSPSTLPLGDVAAGQALKISVDEELAVALPLSQIRAISPSVEPVRLPASTEFVYGVLAWDEKIAYWVDWRRILGLEGEPPLEPARWIIAELPSQSLIAFPSSSMMAAMDTAEALDLLDATGVPYPAVIAAAARHENQLLVFPDLDALTALHGSTSATVHESVSDTLPGGVTPVQ